MILESNTEITKHLCKDSGDNYDILGAKQEFISSIQEKSKENCIHSLTKIFVYVTECDKNNQKLQIDELSKDEEFIQALHECVDIDDNETFLLCSVVIELLTSVSSLFSSTAYSCGFFEYYLEKTKELNIQTMKYSLPILCNIAIDVKEAFTALLFNDIFDLLNVYDECDLNEQETLISFLKSFLLLLDDEQKEIVVSYGEKVFDILKNAAGEENEEIVNACIMFFDEMIKIDGEKDFLVSFVTSFLLENIISFPTSAKLNSFIFFNHLFDNNTINEENIPEINYEGIIAIVDNEKENELLEQVFLFLIKVCKCSEETVRCLEENIDFVQLLSVIKEGTAKVKMCGIEFICTLILNTEINELLNKFMFEDLIEYMIEIDEMENTSSCSLHSIAALTKLFISCDDHQELKDIIEPFVIG